MSELLKTQQELFFDPFAIGGEEDFDPIISHQILWERYQNEEIRHDYTADKFVADTQALMMDAAFVGRFQEAEMIAAQMHILCGEDHALLQSMQRNESFTGMLGEHDQHQHDHGQHGSTKIKPEKSKKKDKKLYHGWLHWLVAS